MVSSKLLELENAIHNLSLQEKLWLLDKIVQQMRAITTDASDPQGLADIQYDNTAKPIWEVVREIGAKIPESEWEKVPTDLSKNFDLYQG